MEEQKRKKKWIKTVQFIAAYLVAAWTFLQFLEWILNRYDISPNWVELFLWVFIGVVPSLAIYFHNQERINNGVLKLREKILFPINIILLAIIMYFGFGNSDLGATTKEISYTNDSGELEKQRITKEEFRVGIPIYGFDQLEKDSITDWMRYGIGKLVYEDLLQNKNISPKFEHLTNTSTKIREASLFYNQYVDGSYKKVGDDYEITVNVRKANNGKLINQQVFKGANFMNLIDEISVFITSQSGITENKNLNYIDLPTNEFISSSILALEAYTNGDYQKAYDIDKNFALAYLEEAKRNTVYNRGKLETQDLIDKAFSLKNKLPLQKQLEIHIQRNLAYSRYDDAEKQVKLQLEVDPTNSFYNRVLFAIYGETRNTERYMSEAEELFYSNQNAENGLLLANASMVNGEEDRLLDALKPYEVINPSVSALKIEPLILKGLIKEAYTVFEDYKLANPRNATRNNAYDSIFAYLKNNKPKIEDLKQFEGIYRSERNELEVEYWINNDRLIEFVKNQIMQTVVSAGKDAIGGGFIQNVTYYNKLVKSDNNKVIGIRTNQHNWGNIDEHFFWKIDKSISQAENAFEKGKLKEADSLYTIAYSKNPKHHYLKNKIDYLNLLRIKGQDGITLQNQNLSGDYGPRRFWVDGDKFYYKRKGDDSNLVKVELLPISENRYMDLTRLGTIMAFEEDENGNIGSVAYTFNSKTFEWLKMTEGNNYFLKDKD